MSPVSGSQWDVQCGDAGDAHQLVERDIPEADYFLVANYMHLTSSVCIYTLYDLGRAMHEITEMAQEVLMTFRQAILDGNPCPWASNPE